LEGFFLFEHFAKLFLSQDFRGYFDFLWNILLYLSLTESDVPLIFLDGVCYDSIFFLEELPTYIDFEHSP
jgi:hypothetical protein